MLLLSLGALAPSLATAQWATTYETFYLQAPHNWMFRNQYQGADRLFNAFDYGHAILYETLWTKPDAPASALEQREYDYLTTRVLVRPPRVPLVENAIEVSYAKLAPVAKAMFDWSHILHRQIYDVLSDERLDQAAKDREIARLVAYYKTRKDLAFSSRPKSMALMQEQPYSLAFRQKYPKFNGLIWGYHWMQVGLYEPLLVGRTSAERQAGVRATVARFWQMLGDPPRSLPYQMPMTAEIAPTFATRYPEAAIIFDNLHSMHDVVSDILTNPSVPKRRKGAEIALAARRYRDDTTLVMASTDAWRTMAREMGVENMGGPAVGFLSTLPTPSVTYGAVMHHDDRTGHMLSMPHGQMLGGATMAGMPGMAGMSAGQPAAAAPAPASEHAGHATMPNMAGMPNMAETPHKPTMSMTPDTMGMGGLMALHERMMADSVIRKRVLADPEMRRMTNDMMRAMPAMTHDAAPGTPTAQHRPAAKAAKQSPTRSAPKKPRATKKPAVHTMPGMGTMKMP